ncbi:hypothetical protein ACH436_04720 [Isoptericola sp. NPDC019693]|uniref:hypothetical protein n=1 Tax=Isoptericola sp. NPDC019693 TaxID=3364009 RepID=UPI0037B322C5
MNRRRARGGVPAVVALPVALPVALTVALSGCAGLTGAASPDASAGPASQDEVAEAADAWGADPRYVLTTTADGFAVVPTAAGVYGADGFSVHFGGAAGRAFMLSAVGGSMTVDDCATVPVLGVGGEEREGPVTCVEDDGAFRRTAGDAEEYAVVRDGALVRVSGSAADHDALREAAANVRVPTSEELAALADSTPGAGGPAVERGDLPPGDGAPDNSVGAGG